MLTGKQRELLDFLTRYIAENHHSPSFDEMREAVGLASKSGIHRLVTALEERGYIHRLANRARAIEVIKTDSLPGVVFAENKLESKPEKSADTRNVVAADFGRNAAATELPLLGRIAAGTPIEALSDPSSFLSVPTDMLGSGEHFALEIVGDSMIEAGIHDGDTVIIRRTDQALSGDIVVALIEEQEATLKTFREQNGQIALEPANPSYETRYFETGKVRVQGKLMGLIRRYR
jgi:repressor LexA